MTRKRNLPVTDNEKVTVDLSFSFVGNCGFVLAGQKT